MKRSNRLVLMLGLVLAVVAFGGIMAYGAPRGAAAPAPVQRVAVVTAAQDLALGTLVADDQLSLIQMPIGDAADTYREREQVVGLVVRRHMRAGEAFRSSDFTTVGAPEAAAIVGDLGPGQRAMAVRVDELSGVGSLVQAGDRVDVMLSLTEGDASFPVVVEDPDFAAPDGPAEPGTNIDELSNGTTVKVLVQNVQVLATSLPTAVSPDGPTDPDTGQPIPDGRLVILGVTPQQAELIRFAQLDGNLSLLLRSPADAAAADIPTTGITLRQLVDEHGVLPPRVVLTQFP